MIPGKDETLPKDAPSMDFKVIDDPSVCVVSMLSDQARAWRDDNVMNDDVNPEGSTHVYCARQYIDALVAGMLGDGLRGTMGNRTLSLSATGEVVLIQVAPATKPPSPSI